METGLTTGRKDRTTECMDKQYAAENNCIYVDYWMSLADDRKGMKAAYATDGVHPTMSG
jgi:hypothetical protein